MVFCSHFFPLAKLILLSPTVLVALYEEPEKPMNALEYPFVV